MVVNFHSFTFIISNHAVSLAWCFLSPVSSALQVTEDDVRDAYRLWHDALSVAAADEEGRLDMNLLTGGTSGAQRQFMEHVLPDLLRSLLNGEWTRPFVCQSASWQVHEPVCCDALLGERAA
jgi:hypothetical protein